METFFIVFLVTVLALSAGILLLHMLLMLGETGQSLADDLCRAPWLDLPITYFTILPLVLGTVFGGWIGLLGALLGQFVTTIGWCSIHELMHPEARKGPRIVKEINRRVGSIRNHLALWVTALVVPVFWLIRVAEILIWPILVRLVRFPRYKQGDWINCSRHKFDGLVGHDLIWCLYCDWMTGVWSLATEMLRNVESFWCPIRFDSEKKCENCRQDFPDIDDGWVQADGSMQDVTELIEERYPPTAAVNPWFGHPIRVTVRGRVPSAPRSRATDSEAMPLVTQITKAASRKASKKKTRKTAKKKARKTAKKTTKKTTKKKASKKKSSKKASKKTAKKKTAKKKAKKKASGKKRGRSK